MKLLYCLPSLTECGGTERVLTTRLNFLAQDSTVSIYVVLTDTQSGVPYFQLHHRVKIIELGIDFQKDKTLIDKFLNYHRKLRLYRRKLSEVIDEIKPDIVTSLLAHEIDFLPSLKDSSIKIAENHFNRDFRYSFVKNNTTNPIHRLIAKYRNYKIGKSVGKLDVLVSLTHDDSKKWSGKVEKIVIPNPLSFTSEIKSDCTSRRIVAAGRLSGEKGFDLLIQAWSIIAHEYSDWRLDIYGEGPEEAMLQAMIDTGIPNVTLHGFKKNIVNEFVDAGMFVLSSRFEGFGLVLIEAMECGLPVVSFDCQSGPSEIITDGIDGLLVTPNDVCKLSAAIKKLIEDQGLREQMGKKAQDKAQRYAVNNVMKKWTELYRRMLNR